MGIRITLSILLLAIGQIQATAQEWLELDYNPDQPGLEYNPLKGFATLWAPSNSFPHSIQGHLFGLDDLMTGKHTFNWAKIDAALSADAAHGNFSYLQVNIDPAQPGQTDMPGFLIDQVDWKETPENLCPDWNNETLMQAMLNFVAAFGERYRNDPRVFLVHFGLYGMWGEWHVGQYGGDFAMTAANQERLSSAYLAAFPGKQLLARYPGTLPDSEVVGYSDGLFFGESIHPFHPWYFHNQLKSAHADRNWQRHAIGGEIDPGLQPEIWTSWPNTVGQDVTMCLDSIHPTWLFSHHVLTMGAQPGSVEWNNAIRCQKMLGYTLFVSRYKLTASGGEVTVELGLQNRGIAPLYADWELEIAVLDADGELLPVGRENGQLSHILPGNADDHRTLSATDAVGDGTYTVLLRVVNPLEAYSSQVEPLRFANTTQDADRTGWLTLGEVTIASGASGTTPTRVAEISLSPEAITLTVGETVALAATITPAAADQQAITWISDHPATASVDANGVVTAGPLTGEATISAFTQDGGYEARSIVRVEPDWIPIPGRIEAEHFTKASGVQTESSSDVGGGLNVGWIDSGDWLQYPIHNELNSNDFSALFRVSSPNSGGLITIYLDTTEIGALVVPNTGGWQSWRSVATDLQIGPGEHYLKLVATVGGFNINYLELTSTTDTGEAPFPADEVTIYPQPATQQITIESGHWPFHRLDIMDMTGRIVAAKTVGYRSTVRLPIEVPPGVYILRLWGRDRSIARKIIVVD